jgi:hypothetical protein
MSKEFFIILSFVAYMNLILEMTKPVKTKKDVSFIQYMDLALPILLLESSF